MLCDRKVLLKEEVAAEPLPVMALVAARGNIINRSGAMEGMETFLASWKHKKSRGGPGDVTRLGHAIEHNLM